MPKREDIEKIMVIGAGPIVIGQACEFDYSGTQACLALKSEGYKVILINSNPATIMTDPEVADVIYIEPITPEYVEAIIAKEKPDALLATMGGQTSLNLAVELYNRGILDKYSVELIGASVEAIHTAEDREKFKNLMKTLQLETPKSYTISNISAAQAAIDDIGYPAILRPAFTLGGTGGCIVYNIDELNKSIAQAINCSPIHQVLIEESLIGWKEYELEVMRDKADNVVIICSIENFDPLGVHTGDSITVAPAQTLSDFEYQNLRDAAIKILRAAKVETGGSNVQFAINPENGKMVVIEMNPRVSRSSALASKATGFPIAKIAAKLAVGLNLDEIQNDITQYTPASFEPAIDYVVTKVPRFAFEKFPGHIPVLNTKMQSVGETMGIGRTFQESFQKALRGLEAGLNGFEVAEKLKGKTKDEVLAGLSQRTDEMVSYIHFAFDYEIDLETIYTITKIDRWFLGNLYEIWETEQLIKTKYLQSLDESFMVKIKQQGFSDAQIAKLIKDTNITEDLLRTYRELLGVKPVYKTIDTCAAEFEAYTPYHYSTYELENESIPNDKKKVLIIGSGPNRIGQGIEFDYCCVQSALTLKKMGYSPIMVNSNPETVSTDYNMVDKLYFEPVTTEDILNIIDLEKPEGVIVQFGGQTPLKISKDLEKHNVKILGTAHASIELAEDREKFGKVLKDLNLKHPPCGFAASAQEAITVANEIGYPVIVRPSYVLGGRAMRIFYNRNYLSEYLYKIDDGELMSLHQPLLIESFVEGALEIDVDAVCDKENCTIAAIIQHIEHAGIHSGDSALVLPAQDISPFLVQQIEETTKQIALTLDVIGLMNLQIAFKNGQLYILEVNPRASRTVPFVSKAIGINIINIATQVIMGRTLQELNFTKTVFPKQVSVKESVFPFNKFTGADAVLGPEMKSTGEVMGIADSFPMAYAKAQIAANQKLPLTGKVFISVNDNDKGAIVSVAKKYFDLGFEIVATRGTAMTLVASNIPVQSVLKIHEGRPNPVDMMKNGNVQLLINTPIGQEAMVDDTYMRKTALEENIPLITTIAGADATADAIKILQSTKLEVNPLQKYVGDHECLPI